MVTGLTALFRQGDVDNKHQEIVTIVGFVSNGVNGPSAVFHGKDGKLRWHELMYSDGDSIFRVIRDPGPELKAKKK